MNSQMQQAHSEEAAENAIKDAIHKYYESFNDMISKTGYPPTIDQIESFWFTMTSKAREVFSEVVSDSIKSIDERELIKSKKENT